MSWWFKRHPDILRRESKALSSDSNYNEFLQIRNNLFVSSGSIVVRLEKKYFYPILIIYPYSYPYSLPLIYLLEEQLSEDELLKIASSELNQIEQNLRDKVKFYYYRHQNSDGSLCILESDNLGDEGPKFFSATTILKRVREWFSGHITNNFPQDSSEIELFAHFVNQDTNVEFLYPQTFFDTDLKSGQFIGNLVFLVNKKDGTIDKKIYLGCVITGRNLAGIEVAPLSFYNSLHTLPEGFDSHLDLTTKNELLNKEVASGRLIKGYWWNIKSEPYPFNTIDQLATLIGDGNLEDGYHHMFIYLKEDVIGLNESIICGIRFPNRKGELEWQLFKIIKTKNGRMIFDSSYENFRNSLANYEKIEAISTEPFNEENFHKRNSTRAKYEILKERAITIVGCGALGGEIADSICKAGIGRMTLVDNQRFKAHNAIRHLVSIEGTGQQKVNALGTVLQNHNPFVDIKVFPGNILSKDINKFIDGETSISISSIADDNIEGYLNEQAIINNKIIFYCRALRGGKAGRIFRVIPDVDACFNCLAIYNSEKFGDYISIPEDENFPTITNECNNPIRPGSAADLKIISSIASRLIIDYLQNTNQDKNHWVWTMEPLNGIIIEEDTMGKLISKFLPPHPNCPYCKKEDPILVKIAKDTLQFMIKETQRVPQNETGGVLVGYKEDTTIVIKQASGPGPKAIRKIDSFEKDVEFCQNFLDAEYAQDVERSIYIGEWHYHPSGDNKPSAIDLSSLSDIANQKEYLTDKPIMIILSKDGQPSVTVHPHNKKYYFTKLVIE